MKRLSAFLGSCGVIFILLCLNRGIWFIFNVEEILGVTSKSVDLLTFGGLVLIGVAGVICFAGAGILTLFTLWNLFFKEYPETNEDSDIECYECEGTGECLSCDGTGEIEKEQSK